MALLKPENTVLQAVAMALSGNCCCQIYNDDGTCCMTEKATEVFAAMEAAGGPSLADCEAFAELKNQNDQPALGRMHKRKTTLVEWSPDGGYVLSSGMADEVLMQDGKWRKRWELGNDAIANFGGAAQLASGQLIPFDSAAIEKPDVAHEGNVK